MTPAAPARVLRLAMVGWGLGHLAMRRESAGIAWLATEALVLVALTLTTLLFAGTSWYLLPFLLGMGFIGAWAVQAVLAYRAAQRLQGAVPPAATRSPAIAIAWLTVPLLVWGTGFWLVPAPGVTPAGVVDAFIRAWPDVDDGQAFAGLTDDTAILDARAADGLDRLRELCAGGELAGDCGDADENLLRDVRVTVVAGSDRTARAVAERVRYVRQPSTFLGVLETSELVPISIEPILVLELQAHDAPLGAVRWTIVNAEAG